MMMTLDKKKDQYLVIKMGDESIPETDLVIVHSQIYIEWDPGTPLPESVVEGIESKMLQIVCIGYFLFFFFFLIYFIY